MKSIRLLTCLCLIWLISEGISAQGIKGTIIDANNAPLPFATIYIEELETGTSSNAQGRFSYYLPSGNYTVTFQFIGYETVVKQVKVVEEFEELSVQLKEQVYDLKTVEITSDGRDPAFIIMRKAIAKAPFHLNQLDSYKAEVYTKGSGRVKKSPFLIRKMMEKEGIDSSFAFVSESVSEVYFKRPNYFEEKIISIYTQGDSRDSSPNAYINASFYEPSIAEVVSPLSPRAFVYYNFTYEGFFVDRGREIDKIRIKPKSKGENVVEGIINIVDGEWSIHSLDLTIKKAVPANMTIGIKQIYAPIEEKAWLPVSHQFNGLIKFYGFHFEFGYLATVSDYRITINPDLDYEIRVIDEKLEKEELKSIQIPKSDEIKDIEDRLANEKKVSRKELRKLLKKYEKEEQAQQESPEVISISKFEIDSNAYRRDSIYWEKIRPVPLNELEVRGYVVMDSLNQAEDNSEEKGKDGSDKDKGKNFKLLDLVLGGTYSIDKKNRFSIKPSLTTLNFNTVDGYNFQYGLAYRNSEEGRKLYAEFDTRYGFARKKLNYWATLGYDFRKRGKNEIELQLGNKVAQYNQMAPIHPAVNTFMTLLFEQNYMKLYEKDFANVNYNRVLNAALTINAGAEWAKRRSLQNFTDHHWFDADSRNLTSNIPFSEETNAEFVEHQATIFKMGLKARPWQKYRIRNKRKIAIEHSSPTLSFDLRHLISQL